MKNISNATGGVYVNTNMPKKSEKQNNEFTRAVQKQNPGNISEKRMFPKTENRLFMESVMPTRDELRQRDKEFQQRREMREYEFIAEIR